LRLFLARWNSVTAFRSSDGERGRCTRCAAVAARSVGGDVVVAAARVLDEGMPHGEDPGRVVRLSRTHRQQPGNFWANRKADPLMTRCPCPRTIVRVRLRKPFGRPVPPPIAAGTRAPQAASAVTLCDQVAGDPRRAVPNRPQIIQPLDVQIARAVTIPSPSHRFNWVGAATKSPIRSC
jgi:hypothetical protein